jgi:hypothetical protein
VSPPPCGWRDYTRNSDHAQRLRARIAARRQSCGTFEGPIESPVMIVV